MHYPIKIVKQRGFTALELIIVLVVGFSIIALSASKMGQLFSASSTAAAMGSILDLYTATRSLRGSAGYNGGTSEATDLLVPLVKAKMVPKGLATDGASTLKNEWNGDVAIKSTTDGMGFDLTYPKVPADACAKMSQNLLNSGSFMTISIEGTAVTAATPVADVVTQCAANSGNGVTMIFQFREGSDAGSNTPPPKS